MAKVTKKEWDTFLARIEATKASKKCDGCGEEKTNGEEYCDICLYTKDAIRLGTPSLAVARGKELIDRLGVEKALLVIYQAWVNKVADVLYWDEKKTKSAKQLGVIL